MDPRLKSLIKAYGDTGDRVKADSTAVEVTDSLAEVSAQCRSYLADTDRLELTSRVAGKTYFAFARGDKLSRAVNAALYLEDAGARASFSPEGARRGFPGPAGVRHNEGLLHPGDGILRQHRPGERT